MKVQIKKYSTWWGPYQIVEKLCFWIPKEKDEYGFPHTAERVHDWGEKLADTWLGNVIYKISNAVCTWQDNRRVKVRIDPWDTWGMSETLGYMALPMLTQLKETKHGSPYVDLEDVPYELRFDYTPKNQAFQFDMFDTEEAAEEQWQMHQKRWDWVLDEMIFAFESIVGNNKDWEDKYHEGTIEFYNIPLDEEGNELGPAQPWGQKTDPEIKAKVKMWQSIRGPHDTSKFDADGHRKEGDRIANGFKLFGKYYQSLWD